MQPEPTVDTWPPLLSAIDDGKCYLRCANLAHVLRSCREGAQKRVVCSWEGELFAYGLPEFEALEGCVQAGGYQCTTPGTHTTDSQAGEASNEQGQGITITDTDPAYKALHRGQCWGECLSSKPAVAASGGKMVGNGT